MQKNYNPKLTEENVKELKEQLIMLNCPYYG